jgi:histidine triad (HIT) family protein
VDLPLLGHLFDVAKQIAKDLEIADDGYRVLMNVNRGGGQVIFHMHLHLLGGRLTSWPG